MPRNRSRPMGRPSKLLDREVQTNLLQALELGVPITIACQAAGIGETTFYRWMQTGYDEQEERQLPDGQPNPDQQVQLDLFLAVQAARAKAAVRNVGVIQRSAQGGATIEETTRKYRDPSTGELVEEKTVKRSAPDWRAAAWYLDKAHRAEYGKQAEQVQITGADGGPIQVTADAEDLARRLTEHLAAGVAASPLTIEAGNTQPADEGDPER